jgi:hypothetical protein
MNATTFSSVSFLRLTSAPRPGSPGAGLGGSGSRDRRSGCRAA